METKLQVEYDLPNELQCLMGCGAVALSIRAPKPKLVTGTINDDRDSRLDVLQCCPEPPSYNPPSKRNRSPSMSLLRLC